MTGGLGLVAFLIRIAFSGNFWFLGGALFFLLQVDFLPRRGTRRGIKDGEEE